MIQKDSGYISDKSNKLKKRSDSSHKQLEAIKRKETADQPPSSNSKQSISNNKNSIFQQFIAGGSQFQSQIVNIDQNQKSPNTFNQINEVDQSILQANQLAHGGIKHNLPPKPSIKASPSGKMKQQFTAYPSTLSLTQQISNSKKQKGEHVHTHLSNFGMQAMGGSQMSKVLQIKNQNLVNNPTSEH